MKRIFMLLCIVPLLSSAQWQVPEKESLENRVERFYRAMFATDLEAMYELYSPRIRSTDDFESWKKSMVDEENPAKLPDSTVQQFEIKSYDWCGEYGQEYRCVVVVHLVVETNSVVEEGDLKALWIFEDDEWYYGLELHH